MTTQSGHYQRALEAHFEASRRHPQYDVWFRYAAETNARGRDLVAQLQRVFGPVAGQRVLDIGSGYAGTCIAAAGAGAREVVGLELSPVQMRLARQNLADHPGLAISLHEVDVLDRAATADLGRFDLVTCDNVLEHVATPAALLGRIRELLADGGRAYVTVPNAFSLGQVRRDCHYGLLGISLLDPLQAARYAAEAAGIAQYDVSQYYRLESYLALLERVGLRGALINRTLDDAGLQHARAELAALRSANLDDVPEVVRSLVEAQLRAHLA
ncbi:MAG: class I SAM-dependent methyltransferase, partial [Myxococcota bacterium]